MRLPSELAASDFGDASEALENPETYDQLYNHPGTAHEAIDADRTYWTGSVGGPVVGIKVTGKEVIARLHMTEIVSLWPNVPHYSEVSSVKLPLPVDLEPADEVLFIQAAIAAALDKLSLSTKEEV